MISSWRRKRRASSGGGREKKELQVKDEKSGVGLELTIPSHFRCPISLDLMKDPVTLSTGISYDRESIETWIESGSRTCPITKQALQMVEPIPNHTLRKMIQSWCVENSSFGVERIPTPRIPVSSFEVEDLLAKVKAASARRDPVSCRELVSRMGRRMNVSEKGRKCFEANGARGVLGAAFEAFASDAASEIDSCLAEILTSLGYMFPLDAEAKSSLGSPASMSSLVKLLRHGDLSTRRNAVMALRDIASSDESKLEAFVKIEGSMDACFKLLEKPICPTSAKDSLMLVYYMVSSPSKFEATISNLVQIGLVSLLLEILVSSDRSMSEKALGIIDKVCDTQLGAQYAYNNVLTMPVLVKKLLRVSNLATEFAVSIIWKLSRNDEDGFVLVEALQVGAFQKLLLLLQVGCAEKTKERVTELLKMLNVYRERLECVDPTDFKNLKRSV